MMVTEVAFKNIPLGCVGCVGTEVWFKNTVLSIISCRLLLFVEGKRVRCVVVSYTYVTMVPQCIWRGLIEFLGDWPGDEVKYDCF